MILTLILVILVCIFLPGLARAIGLGLFITALFMGIAIMSAHYGGLPV